MRTSRLLPALALGAALWVVLISAAGALLSGLGWWTPDAAWPVAVALVAVSMWCVRGIPAVRTSAAPAAALLVVVAAFTVWAGATHSEQVFVRRDAASNFQAAVSLAQTGHRVVSIDPADVGGQSVLDDDAVTWGSPAFYAVGSSESPSVQPQFVIGPAVVYSFGWWLGGGVGAMLLPALVMGLSLLALGVLVMRVVGPWWGAVATGLTGVLFPVLHTARATYSEPLAVLTLVGGLLALTLMVGRERDEGAAPSPAVGDRGVGARGGGAQDAAAQDAAAQDAAAQDAVLVRLAAVAGVLVGGTGFVRVDALREAVLLLPALALGAALGRHWVRPLALALGASLTAAAAAALVLSYRYLGDIARSLVPLVALAALVSALCWGALVLWRRGRRLPDRVLARLPNTVAALTVLVGVYLAGRPLWQVTRQDPNDPGALYVAGMQRRSGLTVDGGRTYAEDTVHWLSWYVGPIALVVALVVLAVALRHTTRRVSAGEVPAWLPALVVASGSTLLTLLRPGITPDHPWADRRLLVVLPLVVVLVVVAAAWLTARVRPHERPWLGKGLAGLVVLSLAVPAVLATWPHRSERIERGSLGVAEAVCVELHPGDMVLMVDSRAANEWSQVVRGMCAIPTLAVVTRVRKDPVALAALVERVDAAVTTAGGRLVLLAADSTEALDGLGVPAQPIADIIVREDQHALEAPPRGTDRLPTRVWLGRAREANG
ncbi:MAG: hypothetical protein ABIU87_02380 [Ornithinibacter sp.]